MEDEDRYTRITLRIPKTLHTQLAEAADRTSKSLNAEIVGRLDASFHSEGKTEHLIQLARLNGQLYAVRDSFHVVVKEATGQLAQMAKANEAARTAIAVLTSDFDDLSELARTLFEGDVLDKKALESEFESLIASRDAVEEQIEASEVPALRPLGEAIRARQKEEDAAKAMRVAKDGKPKPKPKS